MLTSEICPDIRYAYPEGAYTLVFPNDSTGAPMRPWDVAPHNFEHAAHVLGLTDNGFTAYTVLPAHMTDEEWD